MQADINNPIASGMTLNDIDLSYKVNARRIYYDIEVLEQIFSIVLLSEGEARVIVVPSSKQPCPSTEAIEASVRVALDTEPGQRVVGNDYTVFVDIIDVTSAIDVIDRLRSLLTRIIHCKQIDDPDAKFVEYHGWNSARYDLPMLIAALILCSNANRVKPGQERFSTNALRRVSNALISFDGPPWKLFQGIEEGCNGLVRAEMLKQIMRNALIADGHIDLAAIARSQDGGTEAKFPPGLKREMARYGLDIVVDELVAGTDTEAMSEERLLKLLQYNANDVIGTALVGRNGVIESSIDTRDIVRTMYPFTSAKAAQYRYDANSLRITGFSDRTNPVARDCTAAELAGRVLVGPGRERIPDYDAVNYAFPLPVERGSDKLVRKDLLEYIKATEPMMPKDMYVFFDHFRGKDTSKSSDDWRVKNSEPIAKTGKLNIPYYKDGKPLDCYIRFSAGGAHGSVMAGLSHYSDEDIATWTRADTGVMDHQKPTIDATDVVHIDWSSFYPMMASKMELYKSASGVDYYTKIIYTRFDIKAALPHDKSTWQQKDWDLFNEEQGLKFILNNATGAGNMHSKYALLPVDNKTLSMRLIGNMLIWCLAQRLAQAGAFIISTNTDGLFITGLNVEQSQAIIDEYVKDYQMPVEPELTERFINRDTSNRIEYSSGRPVTIGGRLRCGLTLKHEDYMISRSTPVPIAVAHGVIRYMDDPNWLTEPYSRDRLRGIMEDIRKDSSSEPWYHIYMGTSSRVLLLDGEKQQKVTRVVLSPEGQTASVLNARQPVKAKSTRLMELLRESGIGCDHYELVKHWVDELGAELAVDMQPGDQICIAAKQRDGSFKLAAADSGMTLEDVMSADEFKLDTGYRLCVMTPADWTLASDAELNIRPLKLWTEGSKLSGYPSNKLISLPTAQSLKDFDLQKLDMEAYTDWAEQLLLSWKVTADIPQLGLKAIADPALAKATKAAGGTKRSRAINMLTEMYHQLIA